MTRHKPPGAVRLRVVPSDLSVAMARCRAHHRHLPRVIGGLCAFEVLRMDRPHPQAALFGERLGEPCAWAIVGRAVARVLDADGWRELTRSICPEGAPPGCASALLGAVARWSRVSGDPVVTYTLAHETGVSLRAAGWIAVGTTRGGQWDVPSRARAIRPDIIAAPKVRWVPPHVLPLAIARGWTPTAAEVAA
jgi:hypothetical protein